jgi:hypothetical protein
MNEREFCVRHVQRSGSSSKILISPPPRLQHETNIRCRKTQWRHHIKPEISDFCLYVTGGEEGVIKVEEGEGTSYQVG